MFSCCVPFHKVSTKNIYYCGQKTGETDIAHMVSDYVSHALSGSIIFYFIFWGEYSKKYKIFTLKLILHRLQR